MASIDEILASIGLQPGVQSGATVPTVVSIDSTASTSEILAYSFGGVSFALCGGLGYILWRYRHSIMGYLAFRSLLRTDAFIDVTPRNYATRDIEMGNVGLPSIQRPLEPEVSNRNTINSRPPQQLVALPLELALD